MKSKFVIHARVETIHGSYYLFLGVAIKKESDKNLGADLEWVSNPLLHTLYFESEQDAEKYLNEGKMPEGSISYLEIKKIYFPY